VKLSRLLLLRRELIEDRCERAARRAPVGGEIDQDRQRAVEHLLRESGVGDGWDGCGLRHGAASFG